MKQREFDEIMDRFLDGAARVRAQKYENRLINNVHRQFSSWMIPQILNEDKRNKKVA